jgi:hypothetical protein
MERERAKEHERARAIRDKKEALAKRKEVLDERRGQYERE